VSQAATPSALAPAQLKAALWADAGTRVYAVVLGRCIGGLPERLAGAERAAELASYDCLWPGALKPQQRLQAPYLVALKPESPFTDWLLFEAATGFGDWGVLLRSNQAFLALRAHCRDCGEAQLPDGQDIALEWMDPAVLRSILPLAPGDQLEDLFAPFATLVVCGPQSWTFCSQQFGRLRMQEQAVMA
jgi:hypothetical protein